MTGIINLIGQEIVPRDNRNQQNEKTRNYSMSGLDKNEQHKMTGIRNMRR